MCQALCELSCSDGGGGGGDKYDGVMIPALSQTTFNDHFSGFSLSQSIQFITGDKNSLYTKVNTIVNGLASSEYEGDRDISLSEIEEGLAEVAGLSDAQITEIINKLNDDGYVIAYRGSSTIEFVAVFKK